MQQNETDQQANVATHLEQDSERHEFGAQTKDSERVSMETSEDEERALSSSTETRDPEETPTPEVLEQVSDGRVRRKKRTRFKVPDWKPRPVKALWESATDDDRERAHMHAMVILEYWTAQLSKTEAAERLGLAPIRVWQLSQQAVSGMLAGLLTQPRDRGASAAAEADSPERWTMRERALEKKLKTMEQKLNASQRLVEVMRDLPVIRASRDTAEGGAKPKPKSPPKRKRNGKSNRPSSKRLPGNKPSG
jgi:hypothetical protein